MERSKTLNKNQYEFYYIIKEFIEKNGYRPSYRDLMKLSGISSVGTICSRVKKMERLGFLTGIKDENGVLISRTIKCVDTKEVRKKLELLKEKFENEE